MADLTFPELQQKCKSKRSKKQGVKYPFHCSRGHLQQIQKLDSGWSVSFRR